MKTFLLIVIMATSSLTMASQGYIPLRVVLQKAEASNPSSGVGATVLDILFDSSDPRKIQRFVESLEIEALKATEAAFYINNQPEMQITLSQLSQSIGDQCLKDSVLEGQRQGAKMSPPSTYPGIDPRSVRAPNDRLTLNIENGRYSLEIFYPYFMVKDGWVTMSQYSYGPEFLDASSLGNQKYLDSKGSQIIASARHAIEENQNYCTFAKGQK
jgi:hypothetical protein